MTHQSDDHDSTSASTSRLKRARNRFSLLADKAEDEEIERRIRDGLELSGATPWILIFAIFIASVGLNINSTAVVIGAMLISPLMGPIMGVGLGVAVYDFKLVKRALFNLGMHNPNFYHGLAQQFGMCSSHYLVGWQGSSESPEKKSPMLSRG